MKAIIVAYSDGRVIGNGGDIPWMGQMPADMKRVRELTTGNAIIMGRKTFESIGKPLPNRQNIVLTSQDTTADGVQTATSLEAAFSEVKPGKVAFIFGGASVYAAGLNLIDTIYATEIHAKFDGDTYFPEIDPTKWREVERQDFPADDNNKYPYSFVKHEKI